MQLSHSRMAMTAALLWGGCMFLVGFINLVAPTYGVDFLRMMSSVYPGFHPSHNVGEWLLGTAYGLADGAIAGWLFAWIYNAMAGAAQRHQTLDMHS